MYLPSKRFERKVSEWTGTIWADFYNELFHAWWNEVFLRESFYARTAELINCFLPRYRVGNWLMAHIAQEEAYSETISSVILLLANKVSFERLYYQKEWTVVPVDHGESGGWFGFSKAQQNIYPSPQEYDILLRWLIGRNAPAKPVAPKEPIS
jgi:hypothetical protein